MIKAILIYWFISTPTIHYHIEFNGLSQCNGQLQHIKKVTHTLTEKTINGFCIKK